ncbi:hypothetical protein I3843_01G283000 [Carya illinoinensis]|nr:hypothetical protein I3843_01G283000 [Carya illinoinensis]
MENRKKNGVSFFQMPLHYPRYSRKEYLEMPEWKLDRLFAEYGLSTHGDLAYKREFAMGAFLWPDWKHYDSNRRIFKCNTIILKNNKIYY